MTLVDKLKYDIVTLNDTCEIYRGYIKIAKSRLRKLKGVKNRSKRRKIKKELHKQEGMLWVYDRWIWDLCAKVGVERNEFLSYNKWNHGKG